MLFRSRGVKVLATRYGLPRSTKTLHKMAFYQEIMRPQGWRHAVSLCFWGDPLAESPIFVTTVNRRAGRHDFSAEDIALLESVHPFIDCAVNRIYEREAAMTMHDGIAMAVRDGTRGLAILDGNFLLVQASRVALQLCAAWSDDRTQAPIEDASLSWRLPAALVAECRALHEE